MKRPAATMAACLADGWWPIWDQSDSADQAELGKQAQSYLQAGAGMLRVRCQTAAQVCRSIISENKQYNSTRICGVIPKSGYIVALSEATPEEIRWYYQQQLVLMTALELNAILLEGQIEADEALPALEEVKKTFAGLCFVGLALGCGAERNNTVMGWSGVEAVIKLQQVGADGIALEGALDARRMEPIVKDLRRRITIPILAFPQAGEQELQGDRIAYTQTAGDFAEAALPLFKAGADVVGGGRGTTSDHIAALGRILAQPPAKSRRSNR